MEIKIPEAFGVEDYDHLSKVWEKATDAMLVVPQWRSAAVIRDVSAKFLGRIPDDFAFAVLSEIAELPETPTDILRLIFERGDTSCKVSVCIRKDLDEGLRKICLESSDPDVREHMNIR